MNRDELVVRRCAVDELVRFRTAEEALAWTESRERLLTDAGMVPSNIHRFSTACMFERVVLGYSPSRSLHQRDLVSLRHVPQVIRADSDEPIKATAEYAPESWHPWIPLEYAPAELLLGEVVHGEGSMWGEAACQGVVRLLRQRPQILAALSTVARFARGERHTVSQACDEFLRSQGLHVFALQRQHGTEAPSRAIVEGDALARRNAHRARHTVTDSMSTYCWCKLCTWPTDREDAVRQAMGLVQGTTFHTYRRAAL